MFTLFELMTNPNLSEYYNFFGEFPLLCGFLINFVLFGSFGMIALLTGVISESMFEKNQLRIDEDRLQRESKQKGVSALCEELFEEVTVNEGGEASKEDLSEL